MAGFSIKDKYDEIAEVFRNFSKQMKSTSEIDSKTAEWAIRRLYLCNNFRPPDKFFYVKSPVEAAITAKIFCTTKERNLWGLFWQEVKNILPCEATDGEYVDSFYLDFWGPALSVTSLPPINSLNFHNDNEVF